MTEHKYYSLDSVTRLLSLDYSDVLQFIVTGQLIASFIYHKPSDYREIKEIVNDDGSITKITNTKRTALRIASDNSKPIEVSYLTQEDSTRIILNKVAQREILIDKLFFSSERTPKNGRLLVGDSAISVSKNEIIVTREELERFAKSAQIKIGKDQIEQLQSGNKPSYDRPIGRTSLAILAIVIAGIIGVAINTFLKEA